MFTLKTNHTNVTNVGKLLLHQVPQMFIKESTAKRNHTVVINAGKLSLLKCLESPSTDSYRREALAL